MTETIQDLKFLLHDITRGTFEATMIVAGWTITLLPLLAMVESWIG